METFLKFAIYWDMAMWVIGSLVVTVVLIYIGMVIYHELFKGWGRKVRGDFLFHLWIYQAMRAWIKEGNPRPDGFQLMTEREKLETCAHELICFAEEHGYVLTITTEPQPILPLAMGNSMMVYDVREARERYTEGGAK